MGRPRRLDIDDGWHHVMNRGAARQPVFITRADGEDFAQLLGIAVERHGVEVHAYCLMSNHFHLLLHCPDGGLSRFMQYLGSVFTRRHNARVGRDGAVFRGRFASRLVDTDEYRLRAIRYIHRNPLDVRPSVGLDTYRWSSHRAYIGVAPPPEWLSLTSLGWYDGDRAAFDRMVRDGIEPMPFVDVGRLLTAVDLVVDERSRAAGGTQRFARTVSVALLDHLPTAAAAELATRLEFPSRAAVVTALRRARERCALDPDVAAMVERVRDLAA